MCKGGGGRGRYRKGSACCKCEQYIKGNCDSPDLHTTGLLTSSLNYVISPTNEFWTITKAMQESLHLLKFSPLSEDMIQAGEIFGEALKIITYSDAISTSLSGRI